MSDLNWHSIVLEEIYRLIGSRLQGLSEIEVEEKRTRFGPNRIEQRQRKAAWKLFLGQFKDLMILVLIAAAILAGIIGEFSETVIILIIVVLNALLGFIQEYKAERAIEALRTLAALRARVVRNDRELEIPAEELVPGDQVLLEAGNVVPADIRLVETHELSVDESSLTGESVPADKLAEIVPEPDLSLPDRKNMLYKTSVVARGRGRGVVVAIGMSTEIGRIARLLEQKEPLTPLQERMSDFGKKLTYLVLIISALLFSIGILRGEAFMHMLLLSLSLAVAAIPEALPALISIALSRGAKRLAKANALIRKLHAVETLGSVTFICTDKTGTLTQNKMKVMDVEEVETKDVSIPDLSLLELSMGLCHDVRRLETGQYTGDPTEIALLEHVIGTYGPESLSKMENEYPRKLEIPFDSQRRCMSTIHRYRDSFLVITKGAAEAIAERLKDKVHGDKLIKQATQWAISGKRVIAYAWRILDHLPDKPDPVLVEEQLTYTGLASMTDPPRAEAFKSVADCKSAGIKPVMITGDHPATAAAIAREIGILEEGQKVITGRELQQMSEAAFMEQVEQIRVYARVSPEQKLIIVKALQKRGQFVAMTGDGVNDAPSLRSANIGVAMGKSGSDVSKEAAHLILLDDNFATIVNAVREGRRIFDNIRKFVKYIMTCNGAEIWTIFLAPLLGLPMPLLPIHILWINLVTDGLPGLALAGEKAEKGIMTRPPRDPGASIFSGGLGFHIIWVGALMAAITIAVQAWAYHSGLEHWQTIVFTVLTFSQTGHVLAVRSESEFLYRQGLLGNLPLIGSVLLTLAMHLILVYLPAANTLFNTQPLSLGELLICFAASAVVFHAVELEKWLRGRK